MRKLMWFTVGLGSVCCLGAYGAIRNDWFLPAGILCFLLFLAGFFVPEKWGWNTYGKPEKGGKIFIPAQHFIDATRRRIALLKESGMKLDPFFIHTGGNFGYREFYNRKEHQEDLKRFIEKTTKPKSFKSKV